MNRCRCRACGRRLRSRAAAGCIGYVDEWRYGIGIDERHGGGVCGARPRLRFRRLANIDSRQRESSLCDFGHAATRVIDDATRHASNSYAASSTVDDGVAAYLHLAAAAIAVNGSERVGIRSDNLGVIQNQIPGSAYANSIVCAGRL